MGEGEGGGEKEVVGAAHCGRPNVWVFGPVRRAGPTFLCYIGTVAGGFNLRKDNRVQPGGCGYESNFV
jgi:hypothetical protein